MEQILFIRGFVFEKIGFESSPNTHSLDYVAVKRITIAL